MPEVKSKSFSERWPIFWTTLVVIGATGFLAAAMVAPNAVQILKLFKRRRSKINYEINRNVSRLLQRGFIKAHHKAGEKYFAITTSGENWLAKEKLKRRFQSQKKNKWDGYWYVVIFDIKELSRQKRDLLRIELREFGFIKLQNSVWITPYDCEEVIELLKRDLTLGKDVIYMKVLNTSDDRRLLTTFGLKF